MIFTEAQREALQRLSEVNVDFAKAVALGRLLKKAGTSAANAKDRIQKKYRLTDQELKSVVRSVWGH